MPIKTDLSTSPYFDTNNETKNYYRVLFQPGVAVQNRELHELQDIFQTQIERFGDNIFRRGTIIQGCNFSFYPDYKYVKLIDTDENGVPVIPQLLLGSFAYSNTSGLKASVVNYSDGFEATDPDLKTIYIKYLNSGNNYQTNAFVSDELITFTDANTSIQAVDILGGGLGFSNTDTLIVTSALVVNVSTGTFTNGEYITNTKGANLQIIGIDSTTYSTQGQIILNVSPKNSDLANASANSSVWTIANNDVVLNVSNTVSATVVGVIGSGLTGDITTNPAGTVQTITVTNTGGQYSIIPVVKIRSINNTSGLNSLSLRPRNYIAKVKVSSVSGAVGNGYAFGVSDGVIYQKGYFLRVSNQISIISKYDSSPNAISVGFTTNEEIITANIDNDLFDNATGEPNENAPGADRLKLTPTLTVVSKDYSDSNVEFFTIVEWSEGQPYKQNQTTLYNKIDDELATRTSEESGDFIIDPFLTTTRSPLTGNSEGGFYSIVVDPGAGYISGKRVRTVRNYSFDMQKGVDVKANTFQNIGLNYGNFININNLGGTLQYNTGDFIDLYDTAKSFTSNTSLIAAGNTSPVGTKIGTANIRSLVQNIDGSFKLYVFNVQMSSGKAFRNVKSVYYNGTNKGIADVVLSYDATTSSNVCALVNAGESTLIFNAGVNSLKGTNNVIYNYRTLDQTATFANTGVLTKTITGSVDEFFPYVGNLSSTQMLDLYVVPTGGHMISNALTGVISANSTNAISGNGTFSSDLIVGDYVYLFSNVGTDIKQVTFIANNTYLTLDSNVGFTSANTTIYRAFPKNVVIPFGKRAGLTANVDANSNILTLSLGMRLSNTATSNTTLGINIQRRNPGVATKTPNRGRFVKIAVANNAGGINGPWCLGVPDIFRLKNVYVGNSSVNTTSVNSTKSFYIDHNQNESFYDLGYLYTLPKATVSLNANSYLLVEFDHFTSSGAGYYDVTSYVSSNTAQRILVDSQPLANLSSTINSFEIPEVFSNDGYYYDLNNCFDFRPYAANTVAPGTTANTAPLNPSYSLSFGNTSSPANDKKFPLPDTNFSVSVDQYLGRIDSIFVNKNGSINIISGTSTADSSKAVPANQPSGSLKINDYVVPSYPNLPIVRSDLINKILDTKVANQNYLKKRAINKTITKATIKDIKVQQPKGYTMADIGQLDRRLQDVERYVSLNLLESDVTNRIIPSSVNPTLDRFKFGFLVDDFKNYKYSDRNNPQYSAQIEDGNLIPSKLSWTYNFNPFVGSINYIDYTIVSQLNSTISRFEPEPACLPDTPTGNTIFYRNVNDFGSVGNTVSYVDTVNISMAAAGSGQATLYFYNYSNFDKIEIYQNGSLIKTSMDAVPLTTTDKTFVTSAAVSNWFSDRSNLYLIDPVIDGNGYVKFAGKIVFNHNPSSGRNYIIKVTKGSGSFEYRYLIQYPVDRSTIGCPTPIVQVPVSPPTYTSPITYGDGDGADGSGGGCGGDAGGDGCG